MGLSNNIINTTNPTNCSSEDGQIILAGLISGNSCTITYVYNSTPVILSIISDATESFLIIDLSSGIYSSIELTDEDTGCIYNLGDVELLDLDVSATITSINPTSCGISDGEITISGLENNADYVIAYELDSVAQTVNANF